jgi:hypothetical protein
MHSVKKKIQASAAFLGVSGFSRNVVGGCCFHNTTLAGSAVGDGAYLPQ